jgi:hypothetical protein
LLSRVIPAVLHNGSSEFLEQSTVGFSSVGLHDGSFGFLVQSISGGVIPAVLHNGSSEFLEQSTFGFSFVAHDGSSGFVVQSVVGGCDVGGAIEDGGCSTAPPLGDAVPPPPLPPPPAVFIQSGGPSFFVPPPIALQEGSQSPLRIQSAPGRPGSQGLHLDPPGIQPPVGEKTRCDVDGGEVVLLLSFTVDGGCSIVPGTVWELPLGGATEGSSVPTTGRRTFGGAALVSRKRGPQLLGGAVLAQIVQYVSAKPALSVSVWQHLIRWLSNILSHDIGPLVNLGFANTSNLEDELRINAIAKSDMTTKIKGLRSTVVCLITKFFLSFSFIAIGVNHVKQSFNKGRWI